MVGLVAATVAVALVLVVSGLHKARYSSSFNGVTGSVGRTQLLACAEIGVGLSVLASKQAFLLASTLLAVLLIGRLMLRPRMISGCNCGVPTFGKSFWRDSFKVGLLCALAGVGRFSSTDMGWEVRGIVAAATLLAAAYLYAKSDTRPMATVNVPSTEVTAS
jgi:hypothetical protein